MKSSATLVNYYTSLSQNTSGTNQLLGLQLMGDDQRRLLQKYFDNERSCQTTTVGGQSLTTTASLSTNDTSATLTAAWTYPTVSQLVNFSSGDQRTVLFTNGSAAISWVGGLSTSATTAITTVGVQRYVIPAVISKLKIPQIFVGQLRYNPAPVETITEWRRLNTLPYTSNIVNYFFVYNGAVEFFPIPSSTGQIIQFDYKARVPDFSTAFLFSDTSGTAFVAGQQAYDYQAGSLSGITVGGTTITGTSTAWNATGKFPLNTDVSFYNLYLKIAEPAGDGLWYPISQFNSDTSLTLASAIVFAPSATAAAHGYSIGQLPVLQEDFHDMLPNGALKTYFGSVKKDKEQFEIFSGLYKEKDDLLEDYGGTKQVNVDLGQSPSMNNPNLFIYGN